MATGLVSNGRLFRKLLRNHAKWDVIGLVSILSGDYNFLPSTVSELNNFVQYSHCQVVQLFWLTTPQKSSPQSYLQIPFTLALGFQTKVLASKISNESNTFSKLFLLKWIFLWLQMLRKPLNNEDFYETHVAYRLALIMIHSIAIQTSNLSSKLLTKTPKCTTPLQERHFPTPLRLGYILRNLLKISHLTLKIAWSVSSNFFS